MNNNKHFCPDWDFLEIKNDGPEAQCCCHCDLSNIEEVEEEPDCK